MRWTEHVALMPGYWERGDLKERATGKTGVCGRITVEWIFRETGFGWGCGMD
jgi:hypothetical protein